MGIAAITQDYLHANSHALKLWRKTYSNLLGASNVNQTNLGIALTDTFSTEIFLKDFTEDLARQSSGVRQDSGDPIAFVPRIVRHYKEHNVNPKDKTIVFSDSLDVERCLELKKWADKHGIGSSFGVGTFFTSQLLHITS
jgi:nicotinate phosphoribosyltransferase